MRLYRQGLKALQSWVIDREIWCDKAAQLRKRFDGIVAADRNSRSRQMGDLPHDLARALDEIGIKPATG